MAVAGSMGINKKGKMKATEAVKILREHFMDETWTDEKIDMAMDTLKEAASFFDTVNDALQLFDLELSKPSPRSHYVRLWRDGDIKAEVEAVGPLADLLRRTLDRATVIHKEKEL